jgi:hypothetical protein
VSLSDITQLVGTGSVPVVVAGSVLGVFELGEKLASQRAKDALSSWLLTFDVREAGALPDGTRELFERIFGKRHFSVKCFIRSAVFSLGAMVFIILLGLSILPREFFGMINALDKPPDDSATLGVWFVLILWVPWSILLDYLSLLKTRLILRVLTRLKRKAIVYLVIVAVDLGIYKVLWSIGIVAVFAVYYFYASEGSTTLVESFMIGVDVFVEWLFHPTVFPSVFSQSGENANMFFVFFWAGFAPSLWMWLYVLALFVTRTLLRSERIVNWLRWSLDVEKNPFRSIGAVATALAFIATVTIILVSAEVSRIGAAA